MKNNDYQKWAITKDRTYTDLAERLSANHGQMRLMHAVMGLAGEVGEVTDAVKKSVLYNKPLDVQNVKEEAGDILWYMSLLLDQVGSSFEEVMQMNHDKLEKRYPSGFTEKAAVARADKEPGQ
jgi:NTP pyrophosphatase (non-canonical NTP hydrolase)